MIEGFPADIPETWYDCPKAVDRLGPGVVLDAGHTTERKDLASLKKNSSGNPKNSRGLHTIEHAFFVFNDLFVSLIFFSAFLMDFSLWLDPTEQ